MIETPLPLRGKSEDERLQALGTKWRKKISAARLSVNQGSFNDHELFNSSFGLSDSTSPLKQEVREVLHTFSQAEIELKLQEAFYGDAPLNENDADSEPAIEGTRLQANSFLQQQVTN